MKALCGSVVKPFIAANKRLPVLMPQEKLGHDSLLIFTIVVIPGSTVIACPEASGFRQSLSEVNINSEFFASNSERV